jgi:hypothetical protein
MAPWLIISGFGLDDWIYWQFLLQSLVIAISFNKWLPNTRSILTGLRLLFTGFQLKTDLIIKSKSNSKSHCDWRSFSQQVLVSSPIWGSWPDIYYCLTVTVLIWWGALSDARTGLSVVHAAGFHGSEYLGTRDHILPSQIWDFPFRRLLRYWICYYVNSRLYSVSVS